MIYLVGLFLILSLSGCKIPEPTKIDPLTKYEKHTVQEGTLQKGEYWVGIVKPIQEVVITPEVGGKITTMNGDIGDIIPQGSPLLTLDSDESSTQAAAASSMTSALGSVKVNTAKMFDEQIKAMEYQLQQAQQHIAIEKNAALGQHTGKDDRIRILEQQLRTATTRLENVDQVYKTKEQSILSNAENALNQSYITSVAILDFTDMILGVSDLNDSANDAFENTLSSRNTGLKREATQQRRQLDVRRQSLESSFTSKKSIFDINNHIQGEEKDEITGLLNDSISFMQDLEAFLKLFQQVLDHTPSSSQLSDTTIQQYRMTTTTFQQQVESLLVTSDNQNILGLKGSIQSINALDSQSTLEKEALQEEIKTLKIQIQATKNETTTTTTIADQKVSVSENAYQVLKNQIASLEQQKKSQLASIDVQIAQSSGQANQARVMANNATIKAPFDAIIMERYVDQGAIVGPGIPLLKLGDTSKKIVEIRIPEQYRDNLVVGDSVYITIHDERVKATIEQIAPSADSVAKTVLVQYVLMEDDDILLGSTAKVYMNENIDNNGYIIPRSFIRYQYGDPYIWIWEEKSETAQKRTIKLGDCQQEVCEVVSGLDLGEIIVKL